MQQLVISKKQWHEMRDHVARHAPLEACGLLAGKNDRVEEVIFVRNQAQSPVRFVMDPYEQLKAFDWIESNGLDLLGIFHSHPAGPETASVTDIAEAAYEVIHLIWSLNGGTWKLRGFWIENGRAVEVTLLILEE
ncbi:MAG: M67 family metallopeptidase [Anaerolineae bacterium]|nr:M67 family metallopeptidase [Anaerolineae bacterium]